VTGLDEITPEEQEKTEKEMMEQMSKEELEKKFEKEKLTAAWINVDIYPNGRLNTQEFTDWIVGQLIAKDAEIGLLRKALSHWRDRYRNLLDQKSEVHKRVKELTEQLRRAEAKDQDVSSWNVEALRQISIQAKELMTYDADLAFAQGKIKELESKLSYYADKNQNQ